jgi:hypothetical protein
MNKINGVIGGNSSPPSIKLFNKSLNFQAMNSHDPSTGPMINQNNHNGIEMAGERIRMGGNMEMEMEI